VPGGDADDTRWDDNQPIYWQLRETHRGCHSRRHPGEGQPLPSVRQVAVDFQINPLTVSKAYQSLVDDNLVEKRRGVGMFVRDGARRKLLASERRHFLDRGMAAHCRPESSNWACRSRNWSP
jgi:GntR family transcriptional regulator